MIIGIKRQVPLVLLSVSLSLLPTGGFTGMTGTHWHLGVPLDSVWIKYGFVYEGDIEGWHIDFSYLVFGIDFLIWYAGFRLIAFFFQKLKRRGPAIK